MTTVARVCTKGCVLLVAAQLAVFCGLVTLRMPWRNASRAGVLNALVQAAAAPAVLCMRILGKPHEQFSMALDDSGHVHATLACRRQ